MDIGAHGRPRTSVDRHKPTRAIVCPILILPIVGDESVQITITVKIAERHSLAVDTAEPHA